MKIHFVAAISQKEKYGDYYHRIVSWLESAGHTLKADHIIGVDLNSIFTQSDEKTIDHYKAVIKSIGAADVVVAEASFPSTVNVGHEISIALERSKPVVVLYKEGHSPVFLEGLVSERLIVQEYNDRNLEKVLKNSIEYASTQQDTRFNFFVSPSIVNFLNWIAKEKKVPRAVYLRNLIKDSMENDEEYNS